MKMISRRRSSSERRLLIIVVVGVVLAVLTFSPVRIIGGVLEIISYPLRALDLILPTSFENYFQSHASLREENAHLKNDLASTTDALESLRRSVEDYSELHEIRSVEPSDAIMSSVLLAPNQTPYDSLVIDRGSRDGVKEGAVVYAREGRPIGVVLRTLPGTSSIALFTSPGIDTNVYVRGANVHAKATGIGGGVLAVLIPHGVTVTEGDPVLMPSLAPAVIGTVEWISKDPSSPGTIVTVSQKDTLASLRFVAVEREPRAVPTEEEIRENLRHASTTVSANFLPLGELGSTTIDFASSTASTSSFF